MEAQLAPLTYKVEEAAQVLGIGRNQCYEALKRGDLPSIRIGRRLLVPRAALDRLLTCGDRASSGMTDYVEPGARVLPEIERSWREK